MKLSGQEPAYEAARTWALQPISHPPSGWAQIVRRGIVAWVQATPLPCEVPSSESHQTPADFSPLLALVAAMIAEVCQ